MPSSINGVRGSAVGARAGNSSVRIMIVDDSAVIRGLIKRMVDTEPSIEVVASVGNGEQAVKRLRDGGIDVIILDIEMPVMDGLTALPKLIEIDRKIKIIMASTLTLENAEISIEAMKMGAADYIPKPTSTAKIGGASDFRGELIAKIKALGQARLRPALRSRPAFTAAKKGAPVSRLVAAVGEIKLRPSPARFAPDIIAIGSSTGGPQALFKVLKDLTSAVKTPILITQHMPPSFTTILAKHIATAVGRPCSEGVDGEIIKPGHIYLAPGDFHMTVESKGVHKLIRINQEPQENFCRPSVDPMFRTIASAYGGRVLSVVLTGMGADGSLGAKVIADTGGTVIAQDEQTSVVWGMPGATAALGICSAVLSLDEIGGYINRFATKGRA